MSLWECFQHGGTFIACSPRWKRVRSYNVNRISRCLNVQGLLKRTDFKHKCFLQYGLLPAPLYLANLIYCERFPFQEAILYYVTQTNNNIEDIIQYCFQVASWFLNTWSLFCEMSEFLENFHSRVIIFCLPTELVEERSVFSNIR